MHNVTKLGLLLLGILVCGPALAQTEMCGPAPTLPTTSSSEESIKGQLRGQANFLSRLVGSAELGGQVEASRKEIFQSADKIHAAQYDAYLLYTFCMIIVPDKTLPVSEKLKALQEFQKPLGRARVPSGGGFIVDGSTNVKMRCNYAHDNAGPGFGVYNSKNVDIVGSVASNNGPPGLREGGAPQSVLPLFLTPDERALALNAVTAVPGLGWRGPVVVGRLQDDSVQLNMTDAPIIGLALSRANTPAAIALMKKIDAACPE